MNNIKTPFNFVPNSNNVFIPEWADLISQDIPFSDGVSGTINLTITAKSPIFIRNGHTKEDQDKKNDAYNSFSKTKDGRYFIPGTSIKGEVRSILEILSFSRLTTDPRVKFAQREWDNRNLYPLKSQQGDMFCGYLRRTGEGYEIVSHGKPYRISHREIDKILGNSLFESHFSRAKGIDLNSTINGYDPKTAAFKYSLIGRDVEKLKNLMFNKLNNDSRDRKVVPARDGSIKGDIILTGQPDTWVFHRRMSGGKFYEFVFPAEVGRSYPISELNFDYFKFIYNESAEWKRIKSLIESNEGVPVFFRLDRRNNVKDFGMAFLYKLPYEKSPQDVLNEQYKNFIGKKDVAQCLFGYTDDDDSLKGRVQFCSAFSGNATPDNPVTLVLNSPKASYYPIYIRQDSSRVINYKTYNDGLLAGWKRYHVRKDNCVWNKKVGDEKMDTVIYPLKAGATFKGKIHFHNLRPFELGALLSALTFHKVKGCSHQLGQAKPYGFGKAEYSVELDCNSDDAKSLDYYMGVFEKAMKAFKKDWLTCDQVVALIAIAKESVDNSEIYKYMNMDMNRENNEFLQAKQEKLGLRSYLQILGASNAKYAPSSLQEIVDEEIKMEENEALREKTQREKAELKSFIESEEAKIICLFEKINVASENEIDDLKVSLSGLKDALLTSKYKDSQPVVNLIQKVDEGIVLCKKRFEVIKNQDIVERGVIVYLSGITSFGNFEGKLKKWKEISGNNLLADSDTLISIAKIISDFSNKEKKKYKDSNRKRSFVDKFDVLLGGKAEELYNMIYNGK